MTDADRLSPDVTTALPSLLTFAAAAREASVSISTIQRAVRTGHLEVTRFGRAVRITRESFLAWIAPRQELAS